MDEDSDATGVEEIKRAIYSKHLPQPLPRQREPEKIEDGEAQMIKGENREYRAEIEKLKARVKDLFRENNQLKEYIAELEGKMYPDKKGGRDKQKWQSLLGL